MLGTNTTTTLYMYTVRGGVVELTRAGGVEIASANLGSSVCLIGSGELLLRGRKSNRSRNLQVFSRGGGGGREGGREGGRDNRERGIEDKSLTHRERGCHYQKPCERLLTS